MKDNSKPPNIGKAQFGLKQYSVEQALLDVQVEILSSPQGTGGPTKDYLAEVDYLQRKWEAKTMDSEEVIERAYKILSRVMASCH